MRTTLQKTEETQHDWYIVDAAGQRLGTLAVRIARALSGKHKPTWTPHIDDGDFVIVVNADKIELGGKKWDKKLYMRHSGHPGSLRTQTARELHDKHPERMIDQSHARRSAASPQSLRRCRTRARVATAEGAVLGV
jgi:large subunit ribosomal protein L13